MSARGAATGDHAHSFNSLIMGNCALARLIPSLLFPQAVQRRAGGGGVSIMAALYWEVVPEPQIHQVSQSGKHTCIMLVICACTLTCREHQGRVRFSFLLFVIDAKMSEPESTFGTLRRLASFLPGEMISCR
jgi:hypothetical protein